ncbi:MAG TPA: DUF4245 domain-containing protein [Lapillicoccus sp.]|nr:DUF4245 domain-containing protein [Lapillicoccus sp.]
MSSPSAAPPSEEQPAPPRSRYSMGTWGNMVRSLVVILGMVAVLVAVVPRIESVKQPPVDATSVVTDAVRQSGLPFEVPVGLPDGWYPTNARYTASTDGLPTWSAGWTTPDDGYVAIRQTKNASPAWLQAATNGGKQTGTKELAGRTWSVFYDSANKRTSLVDAPSGADTPTSLTTVVTAIATDAEVATFTTALAPAQPR